MGTPYLIRQLNLLKWFSSFKLFSWTVVVVLKISMGINHRGLDRGNFDTNS